MNKQFPTIQQLLFEGPEEDDMFMGISAIASAIFYNWKWNEDTSTISKEYDRAVNQLQPAEANESEKEMLLNIQKMFRNAGTSLAVASFSPSSKEQANAIIGHSVALSKQAAHSASDLLNQVKNKFGTAVSPAEFGEMLSLAKKALVGKLSTVPIPSEVHQFITQYGDELAKNVKYITGPTKINISQTVASLMSIIGKKPTAEKRQFILAAFYFLINFAVRMHDGCVRLQKRFSKMSFPE